MRRGRFSHIAREEFVASFDAAVDREVPAHVSQIHRARTDGGLCPVDHPAQATAQPVPAHARSPKNARPASGDDRCSSTRAAAPAVDIGAVAKERTRARRGRWAALRPRCADSFQPGSTTGLRGDFCSDTERHTRRPHPLAGSARPPPPTLTKVTVPSSEEGSGLHGPFLPYSGRTSTGSWTAPGGAARPEDRALQRQAQRGATEAPCGLPGPPEEGLYYHFSGRIRLLSSMLAGYVATPGQWLELFDLTAIPDTSLLVRGSLPQVHPNAGWRYPRGPAARYRH
jgi:hypothetical protein